MVFSDNTTPIISIVSIGVNLLTEQNEITKRWAEHFTNVLNMNVIVHEGSDQEPTREACL